MKTYLTTTALATILVLGGGHLAAAQGQQGSGQAGTQAPAATQGQAQVAQQLQQAEERLRQAQKQLSSSGKDGQQPNLQPIRQAVTQAQQALGQVPVQMQGQDAYKKAGQQLTEAQKAIQGQQPNQQQASTQVSEAADALAELHRGMGNGSSAAASGTTGAQIAVQQRAPQVTVQQPAPQITVQQPQPQVTIQQPPPQVTVQQPQPQVTVQQAQPQVNIERQGQPQVQVQQQEQRQATSGQSTGASTMTAPVQPGGNTQQAAAAAGVAGLPLARVQSLVGTNVVGADGKDAGEIQNLLIDGSGQVRAAVVEWGGFLGMGERSAAVPIDRIQLGAATGDNDRAQLKMAKGELEKLPRYDSSRAGEYGREQGWGNGIRLYR
ncbi:PRC-barrel domain-containing protein [Dankookia sp. GCM10030260]|uniref:PRC-barrel domain-containing protein n=1 Tax=Dankookia sp. GCM10030260 TaxID=3273390 RepID=UPI003620C763